MIWNLAVIALGSQEMTLISASAILSYHTEAFTSFHCQKFLAASEAYKVIFWPTLGMNI